jgi:hypothetical protein
MIWILHHPGMTLDHLGYIPDFLREDDPRSAREQFNERYMSGWHPFNGFRKMLDNGTLVSDSGDPSLKPLASTVLRDEQILFYRHDWVAIVQLDGNFEVCRMD